MKRLFWSALFYSIIGLLLGVFYREFTKMNEYNGTTMLTGLHVHSLVLGLLFFIILILLEHNFSITSCRSYNICYVIYNLGLIGTLATMTTRGIFQVLGQDMPGLNHIAGLFHMLLGVGIVWFVLLLKKRIWALAN